MNFIREDKKIQRRVVYSEILFMFLLVKHSIFEKTPSELAEIVSEVCALMQSGQYSKNYYAVVTYQNFEKEGFCFTAEH